MHIQTDGLVLRDVSYKESDKILTVITRDEGKLAVKARGARRKGSALLGVTQVFTVSRMTLFLYKGKYQLNEAELIDSFFPLRDSLEAMSLAAYLAELCELLAPEGVACEELLSVTLNTIYALAYLNKPLTLVKPAFELKLLSVSGFEPSLDACAVCGNSEMLMPSLHLHQGEVHCSDCRADMRQGGISMPIGEEVLEAMRYIVHGNPKYLFSFSLAEKDLKRLENVCEAYVHAQLAHGFNSLDFYKRL